MANFLYPYARNKFLTGGLAWTDGAGFKIMFLNAGVGTQGTFSDQSGYTASGFGISGYAVSPATLTVAQNAGYAISNLSNIPFSHRTFFNGGVIAQFGGTANTAYFASIGNSGNGIADGSDIPVYSVPAGTAVSAFVIYRNPNGIAWNDYATWASYASTTAQDSASWLIAYFDTATGLPVNGNGGDITVRWDNSANGSRIFKL